MEKDARKNDPLFNLLEIIKVRKFKMLMAFLIVLAITVVGVFLIMPNVYEATAKVGLSLPVLPKGGDVIPYLEELRDMRSFVSEQPAVAQSRAVYEKAVIALNFHKREGGTSFFGKVLRVFFKKTTDPLLEAIDDLYKLTSVNGIRGTYIIQISARARSAQGAAQIANTLAKTYIDYVNGLMASRAQMAYDIILGEFESARDSFNKSQSALNGLKRSLNVYDDPSIMKKKLAEYSMQYEQLQESIQTLESQPAAPKTVIVKKVKPEKTRPIQPTESPKVKELKASLKNLKNELDADSRRYTDQHPTIKRLQGRIAKLEEELSKEEKASPAESSQPIVETELGSPAESVVVAGPDINELKRRRDNLAKQIQILEGKLSRSSLTGIDAERLSRDTNQKELEYIAAKEKLEHARMMRDQTREGPIKILDPASPPAYASSKKKVILFIVGLMASLIFGIAVGFISEYFEDVYKSPEEVEKSLNLPVLATIPRLPKMMGNGKSRLRFPLNRSKRDDGSDRQEMRM